MHKPWFKKYLWFALLVNPLLVMIGLTISYQVFGLDTSMAASSMDPFIPFVLVRLFYIPILLIPFVIMFFELQEMKQDLKK
jgi:hypothetical protein